MTVQASISRSEFSVALKNALDSGIFGRLEWAHILNLSEAEIERWLADSEDVFPEPETLRRISKTLHKFVNVGTSFDRAADEFFAVLKRPCHEVVGHARRVRDLKTLEHYMTIVPRSAFLELLDTLPPDKQEQALALASATARAIRDKGVLMVMNPSGASYATLDKRRCYSNRKGRAAVRRLCSWFGTGGAPREPGARGQDGHVIIFLRGAVMELTIGAERVLELYGSPLGVAEAVLEGRMDSYDQKFVWEICPKNSPMWEAAKIRLEIKLKLRAASAAIPLAEIVETPQFHAKGKRLLP